MGGKDLDWGEGGREKLREGGKIPLHGRAQDSEMLRKVDRFTEWRGMREGTRENLRGGAKINLAAELFYNKKCFEVDKTTDSDKNVSERYRESKEEGNSVGVGYERNSGKS